MKQLVRFLPLATVLVLAGCERGPTEPRTEAEQAALELRAMADSIAQTEGEAAALPFRGLAEMVRDEFSPLSTIEVLIDGKSTVFSAIAHERMITGPICPVGSSGTPTEPCIADTIVVRQLMAWNLPARRMFVLRAPVEATPIVSPMPMGVAPAAVLHYADGRHSRWWSFSGTQFNAMTLGAECGAAVQRVIDPVPEMTCRRAEFQWGFSATVTPPVIRLDGLPGPDTHTLELPRSVVRGVQWTMPLPPPRTPDPASSVSVRLSVFASSDEVLFHLRVRNESDAPVELRFPTSRPFEILVARPSPAQVWRSSDGQSVVLEPMTLVIPARDSLTWSPTWQPTMRGELMAIAVIPSTTHPLSIEGVFTVP